MASLIAAGAMSLLTAMPAAAATEIGTTFDPGTSYCGNHSLQSVSPADDSYAAPFSGVITSWSFQASEPGQLKFKVGRNAGGNNWTIVGESGVETAGANSLNTFPVRISVQTGDLIGITPVTIGLPCIRGMAPGYSSSAYVMGSDVPPGTTATYNPPVPNVQLDISARLEADADSDGFGDETQDQCLGFTGPTDGCPVNTFSFGKVKRNKDRGTAILTVAVPGPGALVLTGNGLVKQRPSGASGVARAVAKVVSAAGEVKLRIKSKGKKKRKLIRTGKVKVKANVTFTPTGGKANSEAKQIKLVKPL
jgi:hypothetical protein